MVYLIGNPTEPPDEKYIKFLFIFKLVRYFNMGKKLPER